MSWSVFLTVAWVLAATGQSPQLPKKVDLEPRQIVSHLSVGPHLGAQHFEP